MATHPESKYAANVSTSGSAPPRASLRGLSTEHRVDERGLIACQHPVRQDVSGLDDRPIQVHADGHGQSLAGLLVGTGDPVCTRMSPTYCDAPGRTPPESVEFAMDDLPEISGGVQTIRHAGCAGRVAEGQNHHASVFRGHQDIAVAESVQHDPF